MIISELSDFLEEREKESVLRAISASDKILSSGICQFLVVDGGEWLQPEKGAAVVLFLKNSSEKYYRIIVIEPSSESECEPVIQFDFIIHDKNFETDQIHAKLLTFEKDGKEVGLNFYDFKECEKFHNSVCKRQIAKPSESMERKKSRFFNLFHKEPMKQTEIGESSDSRHVDRVKLTEEQEDLYLQVMRKLKTNGPEEEDFVKQLIARNENKFRESMMVKKESQEKSKSFSAELKDETLLKQSADQVAKEIDDISKMIDSRDPERSILDTIAKSDIPALKARINRIKDRIVNADASLKYVRTDPKIADNLDNKLAKLEAELDDAIKTSDEHDKEQLIISLKLNISQFEQLPLDQLKQDDLKTAENEITNSLKPEEAEPLLARIQKLRDAKRADDEARSAAHDTIVALEKFLISLECKICMVEYSNQVIPRMLKECGHTVCEGCVKNMLENNNNGQYYVLCPFCRKETIVPDGLANQLPKNFAILDMIQEKK